MNNKKRKQRNVYKINKKQEIKTCSLLIEHTKYPSDHNVFSFQKYCLNISQIYINFW